MQERKSLVGQDIPIDRRTVLKAGLLGAGLLIGGIPSLRPRSLWAAEVAKKETPVEFEVIKGNKCKRCLKMIEDMLANDEQRKQLEDFFPKGKKRTIYLAFGSRPQVKKKYQCIAIGKCARNLAKDTPIDVIVGCPPRATAIIEAVKAARAEYDDEENKKRRKELKKMFG